ncbi:MAG: signal peptidase II [Oscillospiraceae bacterium]|nr:signal peptidase II [Oscillospiraceae bacterium]
MVLAGVLVLVGLDQLSKWFMTGLLKGKPAISLVGELLVLDYAENTGISWGLLPDQRWLVLGVTGVVLAGFGGVLLSGRFRNSRLATVGGTMVLAGGLGNLIDRAFNGFVVDFIYVRAINFPVFNIADCCVVCGAIVTLVYFLFIYKDKEKEPTPENNSE